MKSPLESGILGHRHNTTLHGRSVFRKRDVRGHNVIRGYRTPGVGDALDIFVPRGTGVRAMHGGWITRIAEPTGRLGCVYVEDHGLGSVYAHLHVAADLRLGAWVKEGTWLGWVGWILKDPHLHLELWIDGKAVSARSSAELAKKMARAAGEVSVG